MIFRDSVDEGVIGIVAVALPGSYRPVRAYGSWSLPVRSGQDSQDKWFDIHGQATTITQTHGSFDSPYTGENSLRPDSETDMSLTITLSVRFTHQNTGLGFDGAAFPNGEIPRAGKPAPTRHIARLYLKQKVSRFTWILGNVSAGDDLDNNTYSHDPRTQFMN